LLATLSYIRGFLPVPTGSGIGDLRIRDLQKQEWVLLHEKYLRNALVLATLASVWILDWSLALHILLVSLLAHFVVQSHTEENKKYKIHSESHINKRRSAKLCKVLLLANILSVMMDSMTIGGLIVVKSYWSLLNSLHVGFVSALALLATRILIQLMVISLMALRTEELGAVGSQNEDVLHFVFSAPLAYARVAGKYFAQVNINLFWYKY
jgi:hypothetical protein